MNTALICLGSNVEDSQEKLMTALRQLCAHCELMWMSDFHQSADVTGLGADYTNVVVRISTQFELSELIFLLGQYERWAGRTAESKSSGCMPLDIDVVVWNEQVLRRADYESAYFKACIADEGNA